MSAPLQRLWSIAVALGCLAMLALLWTYRPAWPELPSSLSAPVTTAAVEQIAKLAAWLLAGILVVVFLLQRVPNIRRRQRIDVSAPLRRSDSRAPRRAAAERRRRHPATGHPKLVVAMPREIAPTPSAATAVLTVTDSPVPIPKVDDRPLVSLLGPLTIEGAKRSRQGLRARALELIAFLALQKEGAQRDEILEALWPGDDPTRSRQRFYQALRDARRLLGDAIASERDRYWLDRQRVRVDVDEFERLLAEAEEQDAGERGQLFADALALVRDQPLVGLDYSWAESEIRRLRALMTALFERMGYIRLEEGEPAAALTLAERGIELDRYNEALERLAMKAEGALELRQAILDRYERLRRRLDELGLEPERETRGLYHAILGQG